MSDEETILALLAQSKIAAIGNVAPSGTGERKYYAFVEVARSQQGNQQPSNYTLRKIAALLSGLGIGIHFVLVENGQEDLKNSIKSMLIRQFPELVRTVFSTIDADGIDIWVEPKKALAANDTDTIAREARDFLTSFRVRLRAIQLTSNTNVPTRTACLRVIRIVSPVRLDQLHKELRQRGFDVPNDEWLSHELDKLRKLDFVLRKKQGEYSLTLAGLKALGSEKNRRSPDVIRSLALARRGD
jgi:hypothetical protein